MKKHVHEFVSNTTFKDLRKIDDNTFLFEEGIFNSIGLPNLISILEGDFNIKVKDSELYAKKFGPINAIASFLGRKIN